MLVLFIGVVFCNWIANGATQRNPNPEKPVAVRLTSFEDSEALNAYTDSGYSDERLATLSWNLGKSGSLLWEECWGWPGAMAYVWQKTDWGTNGVWTVQTATSTNCGDRSNVQTAPGDPPALNNFVAGDASDSHMGSTVAGVWIETVKRKASFRMELLTGGKSRSTPKSLFVLTASAWAYTDIFGLIGGTNVSPTSIQLGGFGTLGTNGYLFKALGDNETHDITPQVKGARYCAYGFPGAAKYKFISVCYSPTPANKDRTTIGVGEEVYVRFDPAYPFNINTYPVIWTATAGSLSGGGGGVLLTAPAHATNITVKAKAFGESFSVDFSVIKPNGVASATITSTNTYANGEPGAGMHLNVIIGPTNVSFYKVQMKEIGMDATNRSGYFDSHTPLAHNDEAGANVWHPIGYNNLLGGNMDNCAYYGSDPQHLPPPWAPGGSFTWPIPALWRVGNGPTNSLPWSDQVFTLGANGTLTIQKFGHSVTRTVNNVISTQ